MRICELREREVINICSGRRLGCVADVEINVCDGTVEAIIVPGPGVCDSVRLHQEDRTGHCTG